MWLFTIRHNHHDASLYCLQPPFGTLMTTESSGSYENPHYCVILMFIILKLLTRVLLWASNNISSSVTEVCYTDVLFIMKLNCTQLFSLYPLVITSPGFFFGIKATTLQLLTIHSPQSLKIDLSQIKTLLILHKMLQTKVVSYKISYKLIFLYNQNWPR